MAETTLHGRYKEKMGFLEKERQPVEDNWRDIADVFSPSLQLYLNQREKKQAESEHAGAKIFDGNPVIYHQTLSDGIYGNMCPQNTKWIQVIPERHELANDRLVKMWTEIATSKLLNIFSTSNFYNQMTQYIHVGTGATGMATMFTERDPLTGRYWYHSRHPAEIYIDRDDNGEVNTIYRLFEMSAHLMIKKFGEENVSVDVKNTILDNPYKTFKVIHVIEPREDSADWRNRTSRFFPWTNDYLEYEGALSMLREGGYRRFPASVWGWRLDNPEKYPRSPASDAYYDIKGVNVMSETMIKAGQMAADPPINIPMEQKGKVQNYPHGVNYYEDAGRLVQPFDTRINYPVGVDTVDRKLEVLKKHFKVDFFTMLAELSQRMTAFEVAERAAEKIAVLGATVGGFSKQGLDSICDDTLHLAIEAGDIPPAPPSMRGPDGISFDYLGVLAMAQKRQVMGQGMARAIEELTPVFQIAPETAHKINFDEYAARVLEMHGAPVEVIRDDREVAKIRAGIQKQIEEQQAAENAAKVGGAMGPNGLNQPVAPDSMAAELAP